MLVFQLVGQIDVLLLGLILAQPFLPIPGVPLGFTLDINVYVIDSIIQS